MLFAVVPEAPKDTDNVLPLMHGVMLVLDAEAIDRTSKRDRTTRATSRDDLLEPGELDEEVRAGAWEGTRRPSAVF